MDQEEEQEEQQDQEICNFCHDPLHETNAKATLTCSHVVHTSCLIRKIYMDQEHICLQCNTQLHNLQPFFGEQGSETTRIQNLFDTNAEFRDLAKKAKKQVTAFKKSVSELKKTIHEKKQQIRPELLVLKAKAEGLIALKQEEVQESESYRKYLSESRKLSIVKNKLSRQHNCSLRELGRSLIEKPGFKRFGMISYWRFRRYTILNRPWRFYMPV